MCEVELTPGADPTLAFVRFETGPDFRVLHHHGVVYFEALSACCKASWLDPVDDFTAHCSRCGATGRLPIILRGASVERFEDLLHSYSPGRDVLSVALEAAMLVADLEAATGDFLPPPVDFGRFYA